MIRNFILMLWCFTAVAALAQDTAPRVQLHGFGEWAYVRTDGNEYLDGNEDGDYDTVGFGLNATTVVNDKLTITGQLALRTRDGDSASAELDYAFAQWHVSDALQVRVGRSKHPFGIYTEVFDIGTLRPFFHLPLSIYGPTEVAAQSYNGAGVTGLVQTGGRTALDYDVYGGEITFDRGQRVDEADETEQVRDVIGGRLRYHTAVDGLSFGASAYTGLVEHEDDAEDAARSVGLGVHGEYAMLPVTIRAEAGRHSETDESEATSAYLEAAYRLGEHLELAGRFDHFKISPKGDAAGDDVEHRDVAVGANYWFNSNFVVKGSLHSIHGFGAARPVADGHADEDTLAVVLGAQFSF